MLDSYSTKKLNTSPSILEVVSRYTTLRRIGREERGFCPLHDDRHPSLRVNAEKGVWYCDPCGTGGDCIRFIELVEGVDFKGALSILGMGNSPRPPRQRQQAEWVVDQISKMNLRLRELDEMIELADEIPNEELAESLWRERGVLADLRDDLAAPKYRQDFVQIRDVIEKITGGFE